MTLRRTELCVALLAATAFLAACSKEQASVPSQAPAKAMTTKPAGGAGKVEVPSPFITQKDEYFYNPVGKRDPFKAFVGELVKEDVTAARAPLERFDLEELVLTGIAWGISDPRGLIRAPDGYSYIVKTNSRVGKNRGRVSRVTRRQIFVEEEYRDPTGKLVVRESNLEIHPIDKEKETEKENNVGLQLKMSDE
jgi:type IV pilus assembly protein PilP